MNFSQAADSKADYLCIYIFVDCKQCLHTFLLAQTSPPVNSITHVHKIPAVIQTVIIYSATTIQWHVAPITALEN